ncbi:MAG: hypothetical protein U0169_23670 [Polyangiaceae bacterium]
MSFRTRRSSVRSYIAPWVLGTAALLHANVASAQQVDVSPPLPNIMVLLDTSGSMEKMIDGSTPATCTPGTATTANRWGEVVQKLTGSMLPYYSCQEMPRSGASKTAFLDEYSLRVGGVDYAPYDDDYHLPFRRPVSGSGVDACVYAPGALPGVLAGSGAGRAAAGGPRAAAGTSAFAFPSDAIRSHLASNALTACTMTQGTDGFLDVAKDVARVGLMTFDTLPESGIGVSLSPPESLIPTPTSPFGGMWSYFDDWKTGGAGVVGQLGNCAGATGMEVGIRNPAAPPWEGRLIGVPSNYDATALEVAAHNEQVQLAINAMRPYGATPIAGMLDDAAKYFWTDSTGPKDDPYVRGNCREQAIILLSDGVPNQDLRTACEARAGESPQGMCPYDKPQVIAEKLAQGSWPGSNGKKVKTYVVGFAAGSDDTGPTNVTTSTCSDLVTNGTLDTTCDNPDPDVQRKYTACCALQRIAVSGGTTSAYFADNANALKSALSDILSRIGTLTTTRTVPAYSPASATLATSGKTATTRFLSSFKPRQGKLASGNISRQRVLCSTVADSLEATEPTIDQAVGDDFAYNLNTVQGTARRYFTVNPGGASDDNAGDKPEATIRPYLATRSDYVAPGDAVSSYGGTHIGTTWAAVRDDVPSLALGMTSTSSRCRDRRGTSSLELTGTTGRNACGQVALAYALGQNPSVSLPSFNSGTREFDPFVTRVGDAFGSIFHATPTVVGPPKALLREPAYQTFSTQFGNRLPYLFAVTNDGILHAFNAQARSPDKIDEAGFGDDTRLTWEKTELWAFVPPAVLPKLITQYPAVNQNLLDGTPVVNDVVWDRLKEQVKAPAAADDDTKWHTMLAAGFGSTQRGYYSLDVTQAELSDSTTADDLDNANANAKKPSAPQFRWQITDMPPEADASVRQLFGVRGGTPAITTVALRDSATGPLHEIGVAILPGGVDGAPLAGESCARRTPEDSTITTFKPRANVRCWGATNAANARVTGRSVVVVRIDTGEVIAVFARADSGAGDKDVPSIIPSGRVINSAFDSPMTGTPVVFPPEPGTIAQKVYIGDADGTIWKLDLTAQTVGDWKASLFFDTQNQTVDPDAVGSYARGQNINVTPVLSLDNFGNVVLGIGTGDQENYTRSGTNYIYSITEKLAGAAPQTLRPVVNWYLALANGERVSGPMAIFNSTLYFATYQAATDNALCTGGESKLYGRDYIRCGADETDTSCNASTPTTLGVGGIPRYPADAPVSYVVVGSTSSQTGFAGKVVPGVSVAATPSCVGTEASASNDAYVPGATHVGVTGASQGRYELFGQVGAPSSASGNRAASLRESLPTPSAPPMISSWGGVLTD